MLWEIAICPLDKSLDREAARVVEEAQALGFKTIASVRAGRSFLIEGKATRETIEQLAAASLADPVVESFTVRQLPDESSHDAEDRLLNVLYKPGVTDNVGYSTRESLRAAGYEIDAVATVRTYCVQGEPSGTDLKQFRNRVLANDAIEEIVEGPLRMQTIGLGQPYRFQKRVVELTGLDDVQLLKISRDGQLSLSLAEMKVIQGYFASLGRPATDVELETIAQTWSEHCSHKTLAGRIRYREGEQTIEFGNMLKETIFAATVQIREQLGADDWCVSVFKDNAGVVRFEDGLHICFKVETHNHPSAIEPYGGANTGLGGVIRDTLGTGLGGRPVCSTDVFCFGPPELPESELPPGALHPRTVLRGVVSGVRDYGNRMGIPTVNGAVFFDERYVGNPLVFCGNVATLPADRVEKQVIPGDLVVAMGGRTGRDGIHGATFSSVELTEESETVSGGSVQIGNAITEKMVADVLLAARDRDLFRAVTDCGAGGFSSAVGEMGEETGAEIDLEKAPLKYAGLSYTEIWISEAQERMVLAVPPEKLTALFELCAAEGVEANVLGRFTGTGRLVLKYQGQTVADLETQFLHNGRPPVVREAVYDVPQATALPRPAKPDHRQTLLKILASPNVRSKEWIIRQYDHEVQSNSVVKPLVGVNEDGPSDAAVVRPSLQSRRSIAIACGMNPRYGEFDPYWMAAAAIDEALRNCVAVGADPNRIALLDNFCWGNCERPETLGSLVRAAIACRDISIAYRTPFISGKDSLYNEFSFTDSQGERRTVAIPPSLLISALGQLRDCSDAITMDLKREGSLLYLIGETRDELGGSHYALVEGLTGGVPPRLNPTKSMAIFRTVHAAMRRKLVFACHDLSEGGLAVAVAEMAFAGGFGVDLDLAALSTDGLDDAALLFSESNSRFLIEVASQNAAEFEELLGSVCCSKIGTVTATDRVTIRRGSAGILIESSTTELKAAWQTELF